MVVQAPLKLTISNYPSDQKEELMLVNNPENPEAGSRSVIFSKEVYIEKTDFLEDPPKKYFRLSPGNEVRLKGAYIIKAEDVIKIPTEISLRLYALMIQNLKVAQAL